MTTQRATMQGHAPSLSFGAVTPAPTPLPEPTADAPVELVMNPGDKWDKSVMHVNQHAWVIRRNIRRNIRRHIPQMAPGNLQPGETIAIVGGGWSLNDPAVYEELRQLHFEGAKIVALNGAANWLMERNLRPSAHIVLDSRPENIEFVRDPIPRCRYLLASQCDPSLFDACEDRDVNIFHLFTADEEGAPAPRRADPIERRLNSFYAGRWVKVPTAGTIGTVAPMLCRILGFTNQHLFGIDSCYHRESGEHHAYAQPWNDGEGAVDFVSGDRVFRCSAWQASQAQSFMEMLAAYGDQMKITVHGDGLIAHMLMLAALEGERTNSEEK